MSSNPRVFGKSIDDFLTPEIRTVAIAGHVRPDGDAAGSVLGLKNYLAENYGDLKVYAFLEPLRDALLSLPGAGDLIHAFPAEGVPASFDLFFMLDCGDTDRLGFAGEALKASRKTVCIDHHISNSGCAEENFIFPDKSSTCEVVYEMLDDEKMGLDTAICLYTGILHDTGVFHHSCTGERTMQIAGRLMAMGVDYPRIIDDSFYAMSYPANRLMGRCVAEAKLVFGGRGIISTCTMDTVAAFEADPGDLGCVIDQLRMTKGVDVAIFVHGTAVADEFKVSMRSNTGSLDLASAAVSMGGGGHRMAAGCTVKAEKIEDAAKTVLQVLSAQM